jgi:hypothetical protein
MMPNLGNARTEQGPTPVQVMARGAAAGLAATLVLSVLSRALPGLWNERGEERKPEKPRLPDDAEDREAVRAWQEQSQAPAAFRASANEPQGQDTYSAATPDVALTLPLGPGPEGLAEQFAFKVASGVFDRDISPFVRPAGMATHLTYGVAWGVLYGLLQASYRLQHRLFGPLFGLLVWAIGPAGLVPAMKIMGRPTEEPRDRTALLILGHVIYGTVAAEVFEALDGREE